MPAALEGDRGERGSPKENNSRKERPLSFDRKQQQYYGKFVR